MWTVRRSPSLAIEWAALVMQLLALSSNVGLILFLLMGKLRNKRMETILLVLGIVGICFMGLSLVNQYFLQNLYAEFFTRILGSSTALGMTMGHMEILKLLSVLTDFWNDDKVLRLQFFTIICHYLCHAMFYTEPIFAILQIPPPPMYRDASYVLFSISFIAIVTFCSLNDNYLAYKVYKDAQISQSSRNGDPVTEQRKADELKRKYFMLCLSFFIVTPTDLMAATAYIVGLWMDQSNQRFAYALQRIAVSNLMFHALYLTHIFLRIRGIKFSKPLQAIPEPIGEPSIQTPDNTKDMIKHYFSFDHDKASHLFGGTHDSSEIEPM
jgi:hypothetical protein